VGLAALIAAAAVAVSPASYVESRQQSDGGFAEPSGTTSPELTAWAAVGLYAAGGGSGKGLSYLVAHERELSSPTSIALVALAQAVLGRDPEALLSRLPPQPHAVNEAIWDVLALRQARRAAPRAVVRYLLRSQARNGGFGWARGGRPDSNDTSFAVQALRAAGIRGKPVTRALAFLRTFERRDGGFELSRGRGSDAQSTAVAVQAFVAAGVKPPARAFVYLAGLRRADGSYRYSARYAVTPVWVTSQVLPALARKSLPLR
jgi:Prenyltransferase and squalene oxidase repeat